MSRGETDKKGVDEVQDIIDCIESNMREYKILDGDEKSIFLKSQRTGCDFEISVREIV